MEYYLLGFSSNNIVKYCIWMTNRTDRKYCDINRKIVTFESEREALSYACSKNINLDINNKYICKFEKIKVINNNLGNVLDFWNLTADITKTLGINFLGNRKSPVVNRIYYKLFHGCNLFKKKDVGPYIPKFNDNEMHILNKIIKDGEKIICRYIFEM